MRLHIPALVSEIGTPSQLGVPMSMCVFDVVWVCISYINLQTHHVGVPGVAREAFLPPVLETV